MTEEEVKIKLVLPYLRSVGLQCGDLQFEGTFSLQIGTNKVLVNGRTRSSGTVGGRFDILVKRSSSNLFVVELKESGHALNDEDRDQAVTYARLVHPIAPYALVTNGNEWRVFDSITKQPVAPTEIRIKDRYHLVLPDTDRDQAIRYFLGYSIENVLEFCKSQVTEHLKPLIGSPQDLTKKYIPELTVVREDFHRQVVAFENSPANGFLLIADSGVGKTSALCDYVLRRLASGKPTVFFWGLALDGSLLSAITTEFGWTFSEELTPITLIRRLSDLAHESPIIFVVDAIDEWPHPNRGQNLVNLIRSSREHRIKFVFSCRSAAWDSISKPLGSDIGFGSYLFQSAGAVDPKEMYQLGPLNDREFFRAIDKYRKVFDFSGAFEDKVLDEARINPFLLRVIFAVASEHTQKHLTFSSREFFERYLELLLHKCGHDNLSRARFQIIAVAQLMFDLNEDTLSEFEVRRGLSLSPNETLLPALFEQNILQRAGDRYSFYFQHLRNYLIAFEVYHWDRTTPSDLQRIGRHGVQGEVLQFYLRYASQEQMRGVAEPIWTNAQEYLDQYKVVVARHFSGLERELVPGTEDELGFVAEYIVPLHSIGGYGFRRRAVHQPSVSLVPVDKFFSKTNLLYMAGAQGLTHFGSSNGFLSLDIRKEVMEHEIIERVARVIEQRHLHSPGCTKLASETLLSIVRQNHDVFENLFDPYSRTLIFPVTVDSIGQAIRQAQLRSHFEFEIVERKKAAGQLKEHWWKDGGVSYVIEYSNHERKEIEAKIDDAITTGRAPEFRGVSRILLDLEIDVNRAIQSGELKEIAGLPWYTEYFLVTSVRSDYETGLQRTNEHLQNLYKEFLDTYRTIVDVNFPTLKEAFALRSQMPLRLYLVVTLSPFDSGSELTGKLVSAFEKLPSGSENEVVMCSYEELQTVPLKGAYYCGRFVSEAYGALLRLEQRMYHFGSELLAKMVYERIEEEWPAVANQLRQSEGIAVSDDPKPADVFL